MGSHHRQGNPLPAQASSSPAAGGPGPRWLHERPTCAGGELPAWATQPGPGPRQEGQSPESPALLSSLRISRPNELRRASGDQGWLDRQTPTFLLRSPHLKTALQNGPADVPQAASLSDWNRVSEKATADMPFTSFKTGCPLWVDSGNPASLTRAQPLPAGSASATAETGSFTCQHLPSFPREKWWGPGKEVRCHKHRRLGCRKGQMLWGREVCEGKGPESLLVLKPHSPSLLERGISAQEHKEHLFSNKNILSVPGKNRKF